MSVTLLIGDLWQHCLLYKTRCNSMHPLYCALPVSYVPVRVTCGALVPHRILICLLAAEPCSTAGPLFPFQCPCGTSLLTLCLMVWDWQVSIARPMLFGWPMLLYPSLSLTSFHIPFFLYTGWYCGAGVFLTGCRSLSPSLALLTSFNDNNNNNNNNKRLIHKNLDHSTLKKMLVPIN